MNGKCIECKPTALHKRRENRNTVALDADQNQIRRRDIVKVMEGPHAVSCFFLFLRTSLKNLNFRAAPERSSTCIAVSPFSIAACTPRTAASSSARLGTCSWLAAARRMSTTLELWEAWDSCRRASSRPCIHPAVVALEVGLAAAGEDSVLHEIERFWAKPSKSVVDPTREPWESSRMLLRARLAWSCTLRVRRFPSIGITLPLWECPARRAVSPPMDVLRHVLPAMEPRRPATLQPAPRHRWWEARLPTGIRILVLLMVP